MTAEYVLKAAIKAISQGTQPSCFRAWVQGQGYVNDGSAAYDRADYIRQAIRSAQSEIDNIRYAREYAEPGYTQPKKGIFFANWNHLPAKLGDILERMGFECEWSDEWTTCEDCNRAVRTQPDSHGWTPAYAYVDGAELCRSCIPVSEDDQTDDQEATS